MELSLRPHVHSNPVDQWAVAATGVAGGKEVSSRIYLGPSPLRAGRAYLEAMALAQAFPSGRGAGDSLRKIVEPLFPEELRSSTRMTFDTPFAWAFRGWALDLGRSDYEATLRGASISYFDEHGRERVADISLRADEAEILRSPPRMPPRGPYPIHELAARFEALGLADAAGPARAARPPLSL